MALNNNNAFMEHMEQEDSSATAIDAQNLRNKIIEAVNIITTHASNTLVSSMMPLMMEIKMHRSFEQHLRNDTVTQELLQGYLDSLVAFRQSLSALVEQQQSNPQPTHPSSNTRN